MALSNYVIPRTDIKIDKSNSMSVRGLCLEDIGFLVSVHRDDVDAIVEAFRGKALKGASANTPLDPSAIEAAVRDNSDELLSTLLQQFPLVVANVIALACDEPDEWQNARRLPMPTQMEAVIEIARLTFEDAEGFKKFMGNVLAVLRSAGAQAPQLAGKKVKAKTKSTGSTA